MDIKNNTITENKYKLKINPNQKIFSTHQVINNESDFKPIDTDFLVKEINIDENKNTMKKKSYKNGLELEFLRQNIENKNFNIFDEKINNDENTNKLLDICHSNEDPNHINKNKNFENSNSEKNETNNKHNQIDENDYKILNNIVNNPLKKIINSIDDNYYLEKIILEQQHVEDFDDYIKKCIILNKNKKDYNESDFIKNFQEEIINKENKIYYNNNYHINNQNPNNIIFDQNNQNLNNFQQSNYKESYQNYENFTQDFFLERYGHFLPSVLTPTSFNRDISQFLRKDKDDKSEASSRIINIKCEPFHKTSNNLLNKINQTNSNKEIKDCNYNNKIPNYIYSNEDREKFNKFDFFKLAHEIEKDFYCYDFNPIAICGTKMTYYNEFNDNHEFTKKIILSNISIINWINAYNRILKNEGFVKEYNLFDYKYIDADIVYELIKNNLDLTKDDSFMINNNNVNFSFLNQNQILKILFGFFNNFTVPVIIKDTKISMIIKLKSCKLIDSLKIFEAQDLNGNEIQIAYILPHDYYELPNNSYNKRKNPFTDDIIFIHNFNNSHFGKEDKVYFIDEKDFEIILSSN